MRISYDRSLKLVGLSLLPLSRSGPERWFDNYKIVAQHDWDVHDSVAQVFPVATSPNELKLQTLIDSSACQELLGQKLKDHDILIARSIKVPKGLEDRKLLMLETDIADKFENKANLRRFFKDDLPFPEYKIYRLADLNGDPKSFDEIMNKQSKIILQAENSSSSKGTYLIDNLEYYKNVVASMQGEVGQVIVSSYIEEASELSIQGCITNYGVVLGPLQHQVINNEALCNPRLNATEKFCGGFIDADDQDSDISEQARKLTQKAAIALQKEGYKGIFGIDFLLGKDKKLYVTEINARPTGLTPLLTGLDQPLLLLHILELGGYDYKINDNELNLKDSAGLFILHSKESERRKLKSIPKSGTYRVENEVLQMVSGNTEMSSLKDGEFILQTYYLTGTVIIPGGRLARLLFKGKTMDKNEKVLYNAVEQTIRIVRDNIILN